MAERNRTESVFKGQLLKNLERVQSLAARMRPTRIEDFVGQEHLLGEGRSLRRILESGILTSLVFWGPPGTGKTTLARLISRSAGAIFEEYSAVTSKVEDIRRVVAGAERRLGEFGQRTVVFVDEFHRFNKAQQDAFLPHLESGLLILIGATTENPYFVLNPALRSRVSIFHFERIDDMALKTLLERTVRQSRDSRMRISGELTEEVAEELVLLATGDARVLLNLFELCVQLAGPEGVTRDLVREAASQRQLDYSRLGTDRFDMVSAFIKSMRGSDPDAALYWLARLLAGGEQPEFIARRMVIFSAEDVGCAAPQAITVAVATAEAVAYVGMPEARIPLASCCVFLATCPKSNKAYAALGKAEADVQKKPLGPVPLHLRNYDYTKEKEGGHRYKYPHDFVGHHVEQEYLPENLSGSVYYTPSDEGNEARIAQRLYQWRRRGINKSEKE